MLLPATNAGLSIPAAAAVCCCAAAVAAVAAEVALLLQRLADALPRLPLPPVAQHLPRGLAHDQERAHAAKTPRKRLQAAAVQHIREGDM